MWDSLKEHIALVGGAFILLLSILGWAVRLILKRLVFDRFEAIEELVKSNKYDAEKVAGDLRGEMAGMRDNYVDRFEKVTKEVSLTRTDLMAAQAQSEQKIIEAINAVHLKVAENYVRKEDLRRHEDTHG